jgi:transcriptional regulator with XRE-family HTH domain
MNAINEAESVGSRVRRIRMERGIGQERLAIAAHIDQSGLSKFERNAVHLGEPPLRRIANVFQISFEDLVEGTDFSAQRKKK